MPFIPPVRPAVAGQANDKVGSTLECLLEINTRGLNRVDRDRLEVPPIFNNCLLDCLAVPLLIFDPSRWYVAFSLMNVFFLPYHIPLLCSRRRILVCSACLA